MKNLVFFLIGIWVLSGVALAGGSRMYRCATCNAEAGGAMFTVTEADGKKEVYGCPKCAMSSENMAKIKSAEATDFLTRKPVDATKAFYVVETGTGACCPPYWLSFSTRDSAEKFAKGFGGNVLTFKEAVGYFKEKASNPNPDHDRYQHPYHDQDHEHDWDK